MYNPIATYRLQLHKGFNFNDLERIIPYLQKLGVKTIYASPIFKAVPGSIHGYDVTDPHTINPEIGTLEQLYSISSKLKDAGMGWIQDIVPNHMAFHPDNKWLSDVWARGRESAYASYFDIDWDHPGFNSKLAMPILDKQRDDAIADGDFALRRDGDSIFLDHSGTHLPLAAASLEYAQLDNGGAAGDEQAINLEPAKLKQLLDRQHYKLCHWQDTNTQLNYRRFFTINGLISLNIQNEKVFNDYHSLIRQLCDDGIFQGLRVDHIDGLYDPAQYLYRLRRMAGKDVYITIEKILGAHEDLPGHWGIQGTTGYDFLAMVNNLFTQHGSADHLSAFYKKITGSDGTYAQELLSKKKLILQTYLAGDLDNLVRQFSAELLDKVQHGTRPSEAIIRDALAGFLIHFPVYRFYGNRLPLDEQEGVEARKVFAAAASADSKIAPGIRLLEHALLEKPLDGDLEYNSKALRFYERCMQYTGPLMAKGGEDTAMYTYGYFIGNNEVGDNPENAGYSVAQFHELMQHRQQKWPCAMNATATHDTKRGEDARARLGVLTDLADDWMRRVSKWQQTNKNLRMNGKPDGNDEYIIYQALAGSMPMPGDADTSFVERFQGYLQKALREAKVHSDWAKPDEEYETTAKGFVEGILFAESEFAKDVARFVGEVADAGIVNSLVQLVLKFTCPGIPDIYQGCELWDLSMVDPDNRRPVDYSVRSKWMDEVIAIQADNMKLLWQERYRGKMKLWLTHKLLHYRASIPELFKNGSYEPVQVTGKYSDHIVAFLRRNADTASITVAPLRLATIAKSQGFPIEDINWADTCLVMPQGSAERWTDVLTGGQLAGDSLSLNEVFKELPLALLKQE